MYKYALNGQSACIRVFCSSSTRVGGGEFKNITLPFPLGLSPLTQIEVISLFKHTSFVKGELGTHIDRYRSLVMPPSFVRQA